MPAAVTNYLPICTLTNLQQPMEGPQSSDTRCTLREGNVVTTGKYTELPKAPSACQAGVTSKGSRAPFWLNYSREPNLGGS